MTESTSAPVSSVQNVSNASASPKKQQKKVTKGKSTHSSSHPKYSEMIKAALKSLNDRGGSSRAAILKFVLANYSLDPIQANQHLKLALKNGVKAKYFKQTKGNGASGSFKLASNDAKPTKKKTTKAKKNFIIINNCCIRNKKNVLVQNQLDQNQPRKLLQAQLLPVVLIQIIQLQQLLQQQQLQLNQKKLKLLKERNHDQVQHQNQLMLPKQKNQLKLKQKK